MVAQCEQKQQRKPYAAGELRECGALVAGEEGEAGEDGEATGERRRKVVESFERQGACG